MKVPIQLALVSLAVAAAAFAPLKGGIKDSPKSDSPNKKTEDPLTVTSDKDSGINFNRDVKPILSEHCFRCHGPDAAVVAAELRLDSFAGATKVAITPGKPEKSVLMTRVANPDKEMRMPPPNSGVQPLTDAQIETLRRWIASGAKYEEHWSFVPPKMPVLPHVSNFGWVRNNIDRFVLNQLDKSGLKPEEEADRATLASRASLTLTGLPPRPDLVEEFEADKRPDAYERFVDKLLASPEYGEHEARYWLDAVRYGDTHGLHLDNERSIFPYRDWVVRAFNEDLPFDQFTVWQLAGDLLKNPTVEQLIATGYVRMNPTTNEGGAIEAEFQAKNTFDRVDTTSTVFLGLTVACARCHDHKYDPIKQRDYYSLFAFFNSTADKPLDGNELYPAPVMRAPNPAQDRQLKNFQMYLSECRARAPENEALTWLKSAQRPWPTATKWEISPAFTAATFDEAYAKAFDPEPGQTGKVEWKPFAYKLGDAANNILSKENAAGYVRTTVTMSEASEVPFSVSSDDAVKVWVNGTLAFENKALRGLNQSIDQFKAKLNAGENTVLVKIINAGGPDGFMMRFGDALSERLANTYKVWTTGKPEERKVDELRDLYLEAGPESPVSTDYRRAKKAASDFEASIPMTLVAEELKMPREAFILKRGEYSQPTEKVSRALPASLGKLAPGQPVNRLGLAKWLVDKKNPLTARVFVNRLWQQHFGTGIVKTAEDFGSQGEWPVNPALLDYLAVTFMENGWSVKKLNRLIVTSAAFRQRSSASKEKLAKDPENRLISRGPRFRLDAEVIRDRALAASGLLLDRLGGRGFKPYQPEGLWEAIAFVESTTSKYVKDTTDDIYRRSLYLFWKRTSPHPVMLAFDAPMRESCTVRRSRTNTPLQALVTLNEPAFVEATRNLAQRVLEEEIVDRQRLERVYMYALGRLPNDRERTIMFAALQRYREKYGKDKAAAEKLLQVGDSPIDRSSPPAELASWMMICSTLINTDEFLTQH
ncbi:MAG TPA: PSD1 and planctomycete cytochrome C domain-containing protein [Fimbriimonadaceae bacterium]|nr:PSD1 and planctomycete cytochrome C domain-containing protein [Fimbriimonadaceae bacterium]